jgi:hypothetical protein
MRVLRIRLVLIPKLEFAAGLMSPARERKMRGDALTTAGSATSEFSVKIDEVDNEGIFAFSS